MNITFACPRCDTTSRVELSASDNRLSCPHCDASMLSGIPPQKQERQGVANVDRCLVCDCDELFLRKDFSQRLGLTIVAIGMLASCVTWYFYMIYTTFGILFATALFDVLLYALMSNVLTCYRCGAEYRGIRDDEYTGFDLEIHERHRQQQARLQQG